MASIDIVRLDQDPHATEYGIREDTSSRGVDLAGSRITATYADGTSETLIWEALDPYTTGGATGDDIKMFFGYSWHELTTTKPLATLQIDLAPANSVFDTTLAMGDDPDDPSTPGSLNGFPFRLAPEYEAMEGEITATYSGIVNLAGSPAVGDLYTTMTVDFSGLPKGGLLGDLVWNSDIDTLTGPFSSELQAENDLLVISGDGSESLDVLGNDHHAEGANLSITHINGQPITVGGSVTLPSGEIVTLSPNGTLSISNDSAVDETNSFTYTVTDDLGNRAVGTADVKTQVTSPPCFVAGTQIRTEVGDIPVEDLEVGMRVWTRDNGLQPVRWIGRSSRHAFGRNAPVVISAGALGPHDRISVSRNHRVLVVSEWADLQFGQSEVLVKAKDLVNDSTIRIQADGQAVTYVHLLFDRHEIISGNGLESESYHPGAETLQSFDPDTRAEVLDFMPDFNAYGPTARLALKSGESQLLFL